MSEFLKLTTSSNVDIKSKNDYATNPFYSTISDDEIDFGSNTKNSTINISDSQITQTLDEQYANNDELDTEEFNPNDVFEEYEITSDTLQYATGEQLFSLYLNANYSDDTDYSEHNAMIATLLSQATSEQISEFMNTFEEYSDANDQNWDGYSFSYDNLAKQLSFMNNETNMLDDKTYNDFMENMKNNSDLFPNQKQKLRYGI